MTDVRSPSAIEAAFREAYGRAVATLARAFGDIDLAEEAVQVAAALAGTIVERAHLLARRDGVAEGRPG
jgi:predicted RNA polymerase sigma factor